jgi:hypothetical protein
VVTVWIAEIQNKRRIIQQRLTTPRPEPRRRLIQDQISALVQQVGELTTALAEADPADRVEVYRQLGLRMTYYPNSKIRVRYKLPRTHMGKVLCPRLNTADKHTVIAARVLLMMV